MVAHGYVSPGFEGVREELMRNLTERGDVGCAFAAVVDGQPVVDIWGGFSDAPRTRPWREDTLTGIFSGTKGLVATCLVLLIDRGVLNLDAPVASYWPEFGRNGKDRVLVRQLVSHLACLPGLTTPVQPEEATDDVRIAEMLAAQEPICDPGARLYYHAMTFGWLCGELIRRVDGRSVGRFFNEEIAEPLGLEAWIGLPPEQEPRVVELIPDRRFGARRPTRRLTADAESIWWSIWANPPRFASDALAANRRYWRAAEIPASNGLATARSMARLYGCLACGGTIDDVVLARRESVALAQQRLSMGFEPYLEEEMAFGTGFELQTGARPFGPPAAAFGHRGSGGSVHGAWPELRTGFSYVTNTLRSFEAHDPRSITLLESLNRAVGGL